VKIRWIANRYCDPGTTTAGQSVGKAVFLFGIEPAIPDERVIILRFVAEINTPSK
jgi:hypothetical protein